VMPDRVRLPLVFDGPGLAKEALSAPREAWVSHFNTATYEGEWRGLALRSVGGAPDTIYPDPTATGDFANTPLLGRSPRLRRALERLECPLTSARLLALGPGATILEHRDYRLGHEDGEIRLHIPITTGTGVEFFLDNKAVAMSAGECWYLNLNLPHRASNHSSQVRIHLVVDCVVNPWVDACLDGGI
jgi:hypothetical protein